jgi:hypothetical protein
MKRDTRFKPGVSGCPDRKFKSGNSNRWPGGVSGNPAGTSRMRQEFERTFHDALLAEGSEEEAARLLWKAARNGEAWAIQNLCQRFAPETQSLRLIHEAPNDRLDYSKLSDEQIDQLDAILEQAGAEPLALESGEGPTQSA